MYYKIISLKYSMIFFGFFTLFFSVGLPIFSLFAFRACCVCLCGHAATLSTLRDLMPRALSFWGTGIPKGDTCHGHNHNPGQPALFFTLPLNNATNYRQRENTTRKTKKKAKNSFP